MTINIANLAVATIDMTANIVNHPTVLRLKMIRNKIKRHENLIKTGSENLAKAGRYFLIECLEQEKLAIEDVQAQFRANLKPLSSTFESPSLSSRYTYYQYDGTLIYGGRNVLCDTRLFVIDRMADVSFDQVEAEIKASIKETLPSNQGFYHFKASRRGSYYIYMKTVYGDLEYL